MARKHYEWKLRDKTLQLGERTLVMGILNVTPDSFSDGGQYLDPDRAFTRALELEEQGVDIIDIGAESTRPGSVRISEAEELRRLIPVLKRLEGRLSIPVSVDTYKSGVAAKALDLGVHIINDPSGFTFDPELAAAASKANAGLILNHMRGTPETWAKLPPMKDPIATIAMELDSAMHRAIRAGLDRKHIVLDPGLGFGKRKEQNAEVIARLYELKALDLPLLIGASRKQFLAKQSESETEFASAAAIAVAIVQGAHIVRVHNVVAMKAVVEVADEIARASAEREEAELAAKAARDEEVKRERSSAARRDVRTPYGREETAPRKFSVPVVTGVVRPAAFSARPAVKPPAAFKGAVTKDPLRETGMDEPGAEEFALAGAVPADAALPAYNPRDLDEHESDLDELPSLTVGGIHSDDTDSSAVHVRGDRANDVDVNTAPPQTNAARAGAPSKSGAPAFKREASGKPQGFRPGGRPSSDARPPSSARPPRGRSDDDRRERGGGPRQGPPERRGAYGRPGASAGSRPSEREGGSRDNPGDRERPAFRGKPAFGKPAFGKKSAFGDRPGSADRPPRGGKSEGDRPPFRGKAPFGEKSAFGRKPFGDKPSFGDKPAFGRKPASGDRPPFRGKSDGDRPPFRGKASFGEKPSFGRKPFGDKPAFGDKKTFGGKPSFGRKPGGNFGKPAGPSSGRPGGRPTSRPTGRPGGRPAGKPTGRPNGKSGGRRPPGRG